MCDIDLSSSECAKNPYRLYKVLREEFPICQRPDGTHLLSCHDDVQFALKHHHLFNVGWPGLAMNNAEWLADDCKRSFFLLELNPPEHEKYRQLVSGFFAPRAIARLKNWLQETSQSLIDGFKHLDNIDFLEAFALPLSMSVLGRLSGVTEMRHTLKCLRLTESLSSQCPAHSQKILIESALREQKGHFESLILERQAQPKDDLISLLLAASVDGNELTPSKLRNALHLFTSAGFEAASVLANAMILLAQRPDLHQLLRANPDQIPCFVEELLRYDNSAQALMRVTTQPVSIRGIVIPAETPLLVLIGSANRDPGQFADPDEFQLGRQNIKTHAGFGRGIHACLGGPLARLQITIALRTLLASFSAFSCPGSDELDWFSVITARVLRSLPLQLSR